MNTELSVLMRVSALAEKERFELDFIAGKTPDLNHMAQMWHNK